MTRSEFRQAAGEAGVNPNIYGLIIDECMYCKGYSRVTGGKVVGIKWNEEWVTKKETYRPFALINGPTHTALGKVPYVVLKKGNHTYEVEIWKVMGYLNDLFNKCIYRIKLASCTENFRQVAGENLPPRRKGPPVMGSASRSGWQSVGSVIVVGNRDAILGQNSLQQLSAFQVKV